MWQAYVEVCVVNSEVLLDLITSLCCCERKSEIQSQRQSSTHTHTHTNWHHKSPSYTSVHLSSPGDSKSLHTTAAFTDTKTSACRWNSNTFTITHSHVNTLHSSWGETTYFSPLQHWGDWEREIWQRIFLLTRNPQRRDPEAVRRVSSSHTLSLSLSHTHTHTQRRIAHMPNP